MRLTTGAMQREADRRAIEERGIPSTLLMERAASALAKAAMDIAKTPRAAIFCGGGNNGGDGIAAARRLLLRGWQVRVFLLSDKLSSDSAEMLRRLRELRADVEPFVDSDEIRPYARSCGVLIDAMLGTGLKRPMTGAYTVAADIMEESGVPVVSADIASGVDSDTGNVPGAAVRADVTVTFAAPKIGQFVEPGCVYSGKVVTADIGIEVPETAGAECYAVEAEDASLPEREQLSHKGKYGKVLIIAGSPGYTGAPVLAASAAVRAGSGLVYLAVPESIYTPVASGCREAMPVPLPCDGDGNLSAAALPELLRRLEEMDACLIGPGLSVSEDIMRIVAELLKNARVPVILDADGINAVGGNIDILKTAVQTVVTPHEGEYRRLGGIIDGDRLSSARDFAVSSGAVTVLKGHRTISAFPDGETYVNTTGNAGMAKGGSGDVLSGIILSMAGRFELKKAVPTAVWLHGRAGDIAAAELGEDSMKPTDMIDRLGKAMTEAKAAYKERSVEKGSAAYTNDSSADVRRMRRRREGGREGT